MEFDKSRVYTAVNADELKVGSKCFYSWNLKDLKYSVEHDRQQDIGIVTEIYDESNPWRFQINFDIDREDISDGAYSLIYLLEPPQFNSFSTFEKLKEYIFRFGNTIKSKNDEEQYLMIGNSLDGNVLLKSINNNEIKEVPIYELVYDYVFMSNGYPFGENKEIERLCKKS